MHDKDWGDKPYSPDMDFSKCKQSEPTDEYGTINEIFNAMCYFDVRLEDHFEIQDSINLLQIIQKGISDKEFERMAWPKKLDNRHGMRPVGTKQTIANLVHHYLDWLRATRKRKWDGRPLPSKRHMLDSCVKGLTINEHNPLHYDEDPERR